MPYQPIENYGVIGDLNTVALVGLNGSIDFMCFPDFDSPSIFASLLDKDTGGFFQITPMFGEMHNKQLYLPDTNVLLTKFLSSEGVGELTDFMPAEELYEGHVLIRRLTNVRGSTSYRMNCSPRFNYGRSKHTMEQVGPRSIVFHSQEEGGLTIRLRSMVDMKIAENAAYAEFFLEPGQSVDFILELYNKETNIDEDLPVMVSRELKETMEYWKNWAGMSHCNGRWREIVNRSALV